MTIQSEKQYKILGITILTVQYRKSSKNIRLLGFIPLIKIKKKDNCYKITFLGIFSLFSSILLDQNGYTYKKLCQNRSFKKSVLIIEPNPHYHSECLAGYIHYFQDLGYHVDVVLSNENLALNPLCRMSSKGVKVFAFSGVEIYFKIAKNKHLLKKYDRVLIATFYILNNQLINNVIHDRSKVLSILHSTTYETEYPIYNGTTSNRFLLSYFKTNKFPTLNPHYFGKVTVTPKNMDVVEFVSIGRIQKDVRNYQMLISAVERLVNTGIKNFKISIIGWSGTLDIDEHLKTYFDMKGKLSFPQMFNVIEHADYILSLLDDKNSEHLKYTTERATGNNQLALGFKKPLVINEVYASAYRYTDKSAVIYKDSDLYKAMKKAIALSPSQYVEMQDKISELADEIYDLSLSNLKKAMKNDK